jgi:hypothetical protein
MVSAKSLKMLNFSKASLLTSETPTSEKLSLTNDYLSFEEEILGLKLVNSSAFCLEFLLPFNAETLGAFSVLHLPIDC